MKHTQATSLWAWGKQAAALSAVAFIASSAHAKNPTFEQAFSTHGEPAQLHYTVSLQARGATHQLQVWRDGDQRIKRRTDDRIETYAFREAGSPEFRLSVLDLHKHIHSVIDRSNLYRLGNFTDWYDLGHGLRHPIGDYTISTIEAPKDAPNPVEDCQWYVLKSKERDTRLCWSKRLHIPLLILGADNTAAWQVTAIDRHSIPASTFEIHDEGYIHNDANEDIEND